MATAQIVVNGTAGSRTDIEWNTTVSLTNNNNTGVSTWAWYLLSQPDGAPTVALTAPSTSTPSFTATKEGSYLIRLVVNAGLPTEASDQVVAAVRELETNDRIPAAGETTEVSSTEGWANTSLNRVLHLSTRTSNNGIVGGVVDASVVGTLVAGTLLYVSGTSTLASGTSGERLVPAYSKALGTTQAHLSGALGILLGLVNGVGAASANERIRVLMQGVYPSTVTMTSGGAVGDKVYVSDTGILSLTAGTISRQVGTVAKVVSPTTYQVFFSGYAADGAGSGAPSGPAGGVLTGTYPDPDGLQANASHIIPLSVGTGNVVGDPIALKAQDGNASAPGSALTLQAGDSTVVGHPGGNLFLYGGNNTAPSSGVGGSVLIESGTGDFGVSGSVEINTKDAATVGNILIEVGKATTSDGSDIGLYSGDSSAGNGGSAIIFGGDGTSATKSGGDCNIVAGDGGSGGYGGSSYLKGGLVGVGATPATIRAGGVINATGLQRGAPIDITAGSGYSTYKGGTVTVSGGSATNMGGDVYVFGGTSTTGSGGDVTIQGGTSATGAPQGGMVYIKGGTGGGVGNVIIDGKGGVFLANTTGGVNIGRSAATVIYNGQSSMGVYVNNLAAASNQILPNQPVVHLVNNSGGPLTLTSTPTIAFAVSNQRVLLINTSANSVTLQDNDHLAGTQLQLGANQRVLSQYGVIELISASIGGAQYWLEIAYRG